MNPDTIKVVVFDCDGVMFDTAESNKTYYNHLREHFDRPPMTAEEFRFVHMHTLDEALRYLFDDAQILPDVREYRKTLNYRSYLQLLDMEPHLIQLLDRIRPDYGTAIATNRTDTMQALLNEFGMEQRFDFIVTAADVEQPKPHPESLLKVLSYFDIVSPQAIYIGDSELDQLAADAAEIPFVAYRNEKLNSNYHINSLLQVEQILELA